MTKQLLFLTFFICIFSIGISQNNCLDFDGINDYVEVSYDAALNPAAFTVEAWVYGDTWANDEAAIVSSRFDDGSSWKGYTLYIRQTTGAIRFQTGTGTTWDDWDPGYSVSTGVWTHIAIVYASSTKKLYVNGVLIGTRSGDNYDANTSNPLRIGAGKPETTADYFTNGKIDEVRIWNDERTKAEIRANMYSELTGSEDGLVAYYKFNETSGTTADNAEGTASYDGTLTNMLGLEWKPSAAFFGPKNCLDFDGTDDYVYNNDLFASGSAITVECWAFFDSFNGAPDANITNLVSGGDENFILRIGDGGMDNNMPQFTIRIGGTQYRLNADARLSTNTWYHLAGVYDGSDMKLYIDGKLDKSQSQSGTLTTTTNPFTLGGTSSSGRYLDGRMDEVRIWSVARTQAEIAGNMCNTLTGNEDNLLAYYPFDNTYGTVLQDMTSNSNDGTLTNFVGSVWVTSTAFNTWLNSTGTNAGISIYWSRGVVPPASSPYDNIGIPVSGTTPHFMSAITCNNLVVGDGATANFRSSSSIQGSAFVIGTADIWSSYLLTISGSLYLFPSSTFDVSNTGQLTINTDLEVLSTGVLTLESNSLSTGSLIVNGTSTGDVTVQRYLALSLWATWDDGWHFISSPVAAQAIDPQFTSGTYDLYCWWELTNEWVNYKNTTTAPTWSTANVLSNSLSNPTTNFVVGKGYLYSYYTSATKEFSGALNTSDISITGLDVTDGGTNRSWHLLGNPYSCGLTWDTEWTTTTIGGTIQIWSESGQSYSALTADATGTIPATNGFMIQATADASAVTIPASKRVHGGTFYKASPEFPIVKVKANNIDYPSYQESQLLFIPESTTGYESAYDCDYLPGYAPQFYSEIDGMPMAVNAMPDVNETTSIPFTFIKNEGTNFSIELFESENMMLDVWLLDKKLAKHFNLTKNHIYFFTAFDNDDPNRFEIHFSPVGIDEDIVDTDIVQVWTSDKKININNPKMKEGEIKVYNMLGERIKQTKLMMQNRQHLNLHTSPGYYIINITGNDFIINKKVFMK